MLVFFYQCLQTPFCMCTNWALFSCSLSNNHIRELKRKQRNWSNIKLCEATHIQLQIRVVISNTINIYSLRAVWWNFWDHTFNQNLLKAHATCKGQRITPAGIRPAYLMGRLWLVDDTCPRAPCVLSSANVVIVPLTSVVFNDVLPSNKPRSVCNYNQSRS